MTDTFAALGLSKPLLDAVKDQGYTTPSPIQQQAIGAVLSGKDVMAAAQTGTGKTGAFALPIIEMLSKANQRPKSNHIRALILTPTRELAAQVWDSVSACHKYTQLHSTVAFGGVSINPQMKHLRKGCDILVATPGRLLDLYSQNALKFEQVEMLVLDEADRMLDMGFIHDIKRIIKLLPKKRQNLLFSATFSDDIRALSKQFIHQAVEISVTPKNTAATTVEQAIVHVEKSSKTALLAKLIKDNDWQQVLVFSRTKHGANRIAKQLTAKGLTASAIHGNKSQGARTKALADFKQGKLRVLVATDIAARGIDIDLLPNVINYDLPHVPEDYVHRIGRTGRAGATGHAVSFVTPDDSKQLKAIQNLIAQHINVLEVPGMSIKPMANAPIKAPKPKRPKKPKTTTA
ncbi:DEAD/DEAH box helicase [Glaciecola sp. XM2]|jgi:ATP-dependent RNA helicase RhlE|uniref:DEAD/DEAH box helicase n=1 Tax=Glaciecola sp. XM2 TaxID=1914931 RepID=UPI001BDE4884|nr:DEAD/DEAH box helicase [Glaciecola sp. XM2]MBT1449651.1 DEAD/DEAH box helicase [Glaciecola sp. XM2]